MPASGMTASGMTDVTDQRGQVRAWLEANWDPEASLIDWRTRLADSGWGCPSWPAEWCGRSLASSTADVVAEELARVGAVGLPEGVGMHLAAPTILEHGTDDIKNRFLRPTVTGEITWCQLFSEPGAGSDLAGLTTTAQWAEDEWIVNGQKVWNTSAGHADFGLLLARTDWDVPKHRGITYFAIPMNQPGIEVRPLRQMNGHASFNEVFLTDARVPVTNMIGDVGHGWAVALTTLAHERRLAAMIGAHRIPGDVTGRAWEEAKAEHARVSTPYLWYPQRAGRVDLVIDRARATGRNSDPVVRQEIARLIATAWSARWTAQRAGVARALGRPPGPEGSLGKLSSSNIARSASRVHALIAGASGMLSGSDAPLAGIITEVFVSVPAVSIAGGTDEIQRNILGERILGLPREPDPARQAPFRQTPNNLTR
jgi:alkylation response protein AidB-like acyl-CoA dehydrogenase